MSKTLLTESEIRKMMGLANIGALGDHFVNRLHEQEMAEPGEDEAAGEGEIAMDDAGDAGAEDAAVAPGEDEGMEGAIEQVLSVVVDALGELPGAPKVTLQTDDAAGGDMDMDAGEEMGEPAGGEMDMEAAPEEEAADAALEEALRRLGVRLSESLDEELSMEDDLEEGMYEDDMEEGMYEDDLEEGMYEDDMEEGMHGEDMHGEDMHGEGMHGEDMDEDYMEEGMHEDDMDEMGRMEEDLVNEVTRRVSARLLKRLKR